jgi:hypothetical protein
LIRKIQEGIRKADYIVVFFSENAIAPSWVRDLPLDNIRSKSLFNPQKMIAMRSRRAILTRGKKASHSRVSWVWKGVEKRGIYVKFKQGFVNRTWEC